MLLLIYFIMLTYYVSLVYPSRTLENLFQVHIICSHHDWNETGVTNLFSYGILLHTVKFIT